MRRTRAIASMTALLSAALVAAGCGGGNVVPPPASGAASSANRGSIPKSFRAQSGPACAPESNTFGFNGTPVAAGNTVWFSSAFQVNGPVSGAVTIQMTNSVITYAVNGTQQTVSTPNSQITIDPRAPFPFLFFNPFGNQWIGTMPAKASGNAFLNGVAVPVPQGLPAGITPVTWTATFTISPSTATVTWKWGAAAYKSFSGFYNWDGVKPLDDSRFFPFNGDNAGSPETFRQFVTGGATGNGGTSYTGSYSSPVTVTSCPQATPTPTATPTQPPPPPLLKDAQYENNGGYTSGTVTLASVAATDYIVDTVIAHESGVTITPPSGCTAIDSDSSASPSFGIYGCFGSAVGPGTNVSLTSTFSSYVHASVSAVEYTGVSGMQPVDKHGYLRSSTGTLVTPTLTPAGANELPIAIYGGDESEPLSATGTQLIFTDGDLNTQGLYGQSPTVGSTPLSFSASSNMSANYVSDLLLLNP